MQNCRRRFLKLESILYPLRQVMPFSTGGSLRWAPKMRRLAKVEPCP